VILEWLHCRFGTGRRTKDKLCAVLENPNRDDAWSGAPMVSTNRSESAKRSIHPLSSLWVGRRAQLPFRIGKFPIRQGNPKARGSVPLLRTAQAIDQDDDASAQEPVSERGKGNARGVACGGRRSATDSVGSYPVSSNSQAVCSGRRLIDRRGVFVGRGASGDSG
jgi:hypothetical protein